MISDSASVINTPRVLLADGQEQLMFELLNAYRVRNGLTAVEYDARAGAVSQGGLGQQAREHSTAMGVGNITLATRAAWAGYDTNRFTGGDIIVNQNDVFAAFNHMVVTASMRTHLRSTTATAFGAGFASAAAGNIRTQFTYMLGVGTTNATGLTLSYTVPGTTTARVLTSTANAAANTTPSATFGSLVMSAGSTMQISGLAIPTVTGTAPTVHWDVSAGVGFASVSNNGLVTGIAPGQATIRARVATGQNTFITHSIIVHVLNPGQIILNPAATAAAPVRPGEGVQANVLMDANLPTVPVYSWTSSTPGVAAVTAGANTVNATITAGTTTGLSTITFSATWNTWPNNSTNNTNARLGQITRTTQVNVSGFVAVTGITLEQTTVTAGIPLNLIGNVAPATATNRTIVWTIVDAGNTGASISGSTLNTIAAGTVQVRATITNGLGLIPPVDYTQVFSITVTESFVPATGVSLEIDETIVNVPLLLIGIVTPNNATNKTINWLITDDGGTGAIITGSYLTATSPGSVTVLATIPNGTGLIPGIDFEQILTVTVIISPEPIS
jgi:hypothetical protein